VLFDDRRCGVTWIGSVMGAEPERNRIVQSVEQAMSSFEAAECALDADGLIAPVVKGVVP